MMILAVLWGVAHPVRAGTLGPRTAVLLPCNYVPGEVHRYRFRFDTVDVDGEERPQRLSARYDLAIEVVSFDGTSSVVDAGFDGRAVFGRPFVARYATNHTTKEHSIVNVDDIVAASGVNADELALSVSLHLDPLLDFTCGVLGEQRGVRPVPIPFGDEPIPSVAALSVDPKRNAVRFHMAMEVDEVAAAAAVARDARSEITAKGSEYDAALLNTLLVEIQCDTTVDVDRDLGWPTRCRTEGAMHFRLGDSIAGSLAETLACTRLGDLGPFPEACCVPR